MEFERSCGGTLLHRRNMPSHLDTRIEDGAAQSSRKIACGAARMQLIPDSQLGQFLPDVIMLDIFFSLSDKYHPKR